MKKILFLLTFIFSLSSFANLLVYPTRLVLDQKDKVGKLTLKYNGTKRMKFKIKTVYYKQTDNGSLYLDNRDKKNLDDAHDLIRFSPRFVTLDPGQVQVVRIMAKRKKDLNRGEYRAHILFESMKEKPSNLDKDKSNISTNLVINMGVAVPVIYRYGVKSAQADILNAMVKKDEHSNFLDITLNRKQEASTYSKIEIFEKDSKEKVAEYNGISTYLNKVNFKFKLNESISQNKKYELKLWDQEKNSLVKTIDL